MVVQTDVIEHIGEYEEEIEGTDISAWVESRKREEINESGKQDGVDLYVSKTDEEVVTSNEK